MAKYSEVEYIYNVENSFEYRKVLIEIHVEEDVVMLRLLPDHMMSAEELSDMLKGFQNDVLSKKRIKLAAECKVIISLKGKTYNVEVADGSPIVKGITQA